MKKNNNRIPTEKINNNQLKSLLKLIKYMMKYYRLQFIFVIILIFISTISMIIGTLFIREVIDGFIIPNIGNKNIDFSPLIILIGKMCLVYMTGIVSTYSYARIMIGVAQGTLKRLKDDLFTHMEGLPIKYFDTNAHGDIMSIYSSDVDTLRNMITESLAQTISALITIISVIISMFILSIHLTIFAIFMITLIISSTKYLSKKSSKNFREQQENIGKINGYIEEILEGLKVVKVFSYEKEVSEKFSNLNEKLFNSANNAHKYSNTLGPVVGNLGNINFVLTAAIGSFLAIGGISGFSLGALASFLQFTRTLNQPISQISQQLNTFILASAGSERVFKLLEESNEFDEGYVTLVNTEIDENGKITESEKYTGKWAWKHPHSDGSITYEKLLGDIVFENVDFGYNEEKTILHDINLYAKRGQKIAFVGATGAGKTTITNLINRFYDIQKGKIRYDGINIEKIHKSDLRRSLGIVLQDTHLFYGTIYDNIRYGKLDATDEEVIEAAKLANAHQFIKHLPRGYDTYLSGDGSNLSQGQRQLLSIARAAIANPPVLILDEATSSIDTRTEKIVQEGMDKLMTGRTVFVIAHRLSTIKNSDVIIVLDHGKIIERGNHDELINQKGTYYQLYNGGFENQ
ncbi:MAG: ABC transporter ATP-binding protein [Leptotrichiaceae bacterium]|nr:ABC transporter ATP-binding protein [Leptotrichiaceae bacterium]MBP6281250.1 ABC transporter ATP-binding protein [Leptotrichiaceae bacterium]MBP7101181.1 ABC transporter ATP-binding protein [Leptotrichiaceae bacterium]MBP9630019.1 ABC transporter ATP-binding protein [Leptotrichiaceae bacterium]